MRVSDQTRSMMVAVPMPAPTHRVDERGVEIAPFQLVQHGAQDHGAGGAERMAHGDGAAIHIDLVVRDIEHAS